uniref:Uncharacterized protein n=1 Tax=Rhizophora mucronata TaxID=61149 RepID=A0A2P2J042_RHIMU
MQIASKCRKHSCTMHLGIPCNGHWTCPQ